jgi:HEAT repeat protein
MPATLAELVDVRSQFVEVVLAYLNQLAARSAELPSYYPSHLCRPEKGKTPFDDIRQMVHLVADRTTFEHWREEQERLRAAGIDWDRLAYATFRARPDEQPNDLSSPPAAIPWDEMTGQRFKRAIILGDPGFGKTWLLRYEARRLAREAARGLLERTIDLHDLVLPLFFRLSDLSHSDGPLEEALVALVGRGRSDTLGGFVRDKLTTGRCAVLLDGWDEVSAKVRQQLADRLGAFSNDFPGPQLLMTSRLVGYTVSPIRDAKELELTAFDAPAIGAFVTIWFGEDTEEARQLQAMLGHGSPLSGLARIPLMLALLCRTYQQGRHQFPTRRAELYDRCLWGVLRDWKQEKQPFVEISNAYVQAVLEVLEKVAFRLFSQDREQFTEAVLRETMKKFLDKLKPWNELYGRSATDVIEELKRDGILIKAGEGRDAPLLFLHRTFQEHLSASYLSKWVDRKGWQSSPVKELVDRKCWLASWREVIVILAGKMANPALLLELLAQEQKDDLFRHRLALAARCLPELSSSNRSNYSGLVNHITGDAFLFWMNTGPWTNPHFTQALPGLAQVNGRVGEESLLEWVRQRLDSVVTTDQWMALDALSAMGGAGATPDVLVRVLELLRDQQEHVGYVALQAITQIGSAAATPETLARLLELLRDPDGEVRYAAAWAIGELGSMAATPAILARLLELLRDPSWKVLSAVPMVIGKVGNATTTPEILGQLLELLRDPSGEVRRAAASAIGKVGSTAATPKVLASLGELLRDPDCNVRYGAAEAIGGLGSAAATPEVLAGLLGLLSQDFVHSAAEKAFAELGSAAATPKVLARLLELLRDPDQWVRSAAARTIGGLGSAAATSEVLACLPELLRDPDWDVRSTAAHAIADLGSVAATPEVLARLLDLLHDPNQYEGVRSDAVYSIGQLGSAAATPEVLACLPVLLRDPDRGMRGVAARWIGGLGSAAATPEVLACLQELLRDQDGSVCSAAAAMIGKLGSAAMPDVLARLLKLLHDQQEQVRSAAVEAIGYLGSAAATPEVLACLPVLLHDPHGGVRYSAANAIVGLGSATATPEILAGLMENRLVREDVHSVAIAASGALASLMREGQRFFSNPNGGWLSRSVVELANQTPEPPATMPTTSM